MRLIYCTAPVDSAEPLLRRLLKEHLVACGNILPSVVSIYWWKGDLHREEEAVLFMETSEERLDEALHCLEEWHPYQVPKILALEPEEVNTSYEQWISEVTRVDE